jgi:hypothetical protein
MMAQFACKFSFRDTGLHDLANSVAPTLQFAVANGEMYRMNAREHSLNNAIFVSKYGFGVGFAGIGLFLINQEHPFLTGAVASGFFFLSSFFLSVRRVRAEAKTLKYKTFFRWHSIPYSEVRECGSTWVFGYVTLRHYVFPWGSVYFARPMASDSLFGYDLELISIIRSRAHLLPSSS